MKDKDKVIEEAIRECSTKFHQVVSGLSANRLLEKSGHRMTPPLLRSMMEKMLTGEEIEKLCADGFEICVRALMALGAKDVTIFECSPTEEPTDANT